MSLKIGRIFHGRQWNVLQFTESVIGRVEKLSSNEGINKMVDGEIIFEWKPGDPKLSQSDYKELIPPINHTTNDKTKGKEGHDVIIFGEEDRDIT